MGEELFGEWRVLHRIDIIGPDFFSFILFSVNLSRNYTCLKKGI